MAQPKKKKKKWGFVVFLVLLIFLFAIIYVVPGVTGVLQKTILLEYGNLPVSKDVTCYFVRNEQVYLANHSGKLNYHIKEGEKIRKGVNVLDIAGSAAEASPSANVSSLLERVQGIGEGESLFSDDLKKIDVDINVLQQKLNEAKQAENSADIEEIQKEIDSLTQKKQSIASTQDDAVAETQNASLGLSGYGIVPNNYISPTNSIVSYYLDGYEQVFTPDNMSLLTKSKVEKLNYGVKNMTRDQTSAKEPLYKLVDNMKWYVVFWIDSADIAKFQVGNSADLNLPLGTVTGTIDEINQDKDGWQVIMSFTDYYKDFTKARKVSAKVITSNDKGLIVPNESITSKKGQKGVYVKGIEGKYHFTPVDIISTDGVNSVVCDSYFVVDGKRIDTVNTYDEILKRPGEAVK